jgi:hypothetical protein
MGFSKSKEKSANTSQETSQSLNQAFPFLQSTLGGQVGNVEKGTNIISSLLGINGSTAGADAFNSFRNNSSYNFNRDEGINGITANKATRGLLNSGSTLKAVTNYSSKLADNFLNSYLANIMGLSNTGIQAGQILAGAGNTSNAQGTSSGTATRSSLGANFG